MKDRELGEPGKIDLRSENRSGRVVRVWDAESGSLIAELKGHKKEILDAAFSPDGRYIVTASLDRTARVWTWAQDIAPIILRDHTNTVYSARFSHDGTRIVTTSADETAILWGAFTGRLIHKLEGHGGAVLAAEFSRDDSRIVTAACDGSARVWNVSTGKERFRLDGHRGVVLCASFNSDGDRVVTASEDKTAVIWIIDKQSGYDSHENSFHYGKRLETLKGHAGPVRSACFNSSSTQVLTASEDGKGYIWDGGSGKLLYRLLGHLRSIPDAMFNPDGTRMVTVSLDGTARIWSSPSYKLEGHKKTIEGVAFDAQNKRVLTVSQDGTARIWDVETCKEILKLEETSVSSIEMHPSRSQMLTMSRNYQASLWDYRSGEELRRFDEKGEKIILAILSPDGMQVLTVTDYGIGRVWDTDSGELKQKISCKGENSFASFSPDGSYILIGSPYRVILADSKSGELLHHFEAGRHSVLSGSFFEGKAVFLTSTGNDLRLWRIVEHNGSFQMEDYNLADERVWFRNASFCSDGSRAIAHSYNRVYLIDSESNKSIPINAKNPSMTFLSRQGRRIIGVDEESRIIVGDSSSGEFSIPFSIEKIDGNDENKLTVVGVAVDRSGTRFAALSKCGEVHIWEIGKRRCLNQIPVCDAPLSSAVFSNDGNLIAITDSNGVVYVFDLNSEKELRRIGTKDSSICKAVFHKDNARVVTASKDGTARIWDRATGRELSRNEKGRNSDGPAVFLNADGTRIVTTFADGTASLWDTDSSEELCSFDENQGLIYSVSFNLDQTRILTASLLVRNEDGTDAEKRDRYDTVCLWNASTGEEIFRLPTLKRLSAASFCPDGKRILTVSDGGVVQIWDKRKNLLFPHPDEEVSLASLSPDGLHILTASNEGKTRLWDAADPGKKPRILVEGEKVSAACFRSDSSRIVTASTNETTGRNCVRLWNVKTGGEVLPIEHSEKVNLVEFSPDDSFVVTAWSNVARISHISIKSLRNRIREVTNVSLTPSFRLKYLDESIPEVIVPNVEGKTLKQANNILKTNDLIASTVADDLKNGKVIHQSPSPGERVLKGEAVLLTIAQNPHVTVPDVRGSDEKEAAVRLEELQLGYVIGGKRVTGQVSPGKVIWQKPKPTKDAAVVNWTKVVLTIEAEPEIPDIVGKSLEEAKGTLAALGLGIHVEFSGEGKRPGIVLSQNRTLVKTDHISRLCCKFSRK